MRAGSGGGGDAGPGRAPGQELGTWSRAQWKAAWSPCSGRRGPGRSRSLGALALRLTTRLRCHCYHPASIAALELSPCSEPGKPSSEVQREKVPRPRELSAGFEWVPPAQPAPCPHPGEGLGRAISFTWKQEGTATSAGLTGLPACPPPLPRGRPFGEGCGATISAYRLFLES